MFSISLNGWDFNSVHNGCRWMSSIQNTYDLFNGLPNNLDTSQNIFTGGYYRNIPTYGGKTFTLTGYIAGPSESQIIQTVDQFKRLLSLDVMRLDFTVGELKRYMNVYVSSNGLKVSYAGARLISFSLPLVSLDGYTYGSQLTYTTGLPSSTGGMLFPFTFDNLIYSENVSNGIMRINYAGSIPSPLKLVVSNVSNPTISVYPSNKTMSLNYTVTNSKKIIIDSTNKTILLSNGNNLYNSAVSCNWLYLQPGLNYVTFKSPVYNPLAILNASFVEVFE